MKATVRAESTSIDIIWFDAHIKKIYVYIHILCILCDLASILYRKIEHYRVFAVRCRVMNVNSFATNVSSWRGARAVNLMVGWSVASA